MEPIQNQQLAKQGKILIKLAIAAGIFAFIFMTVKLLQIQRAASPDSLRDAIFVFGVLAGFMFNYARMGRTHKGSRFFNREGLVTVILFIVYLLHFFDLSFIHSLTWSWAVWGICGLYFAWSSWRAYSLSQSQMTQNS
jgi:hypothetical protein